LNLQNADEIHHRDDGKILIALFGVNVPSVDFSAKRSIIAVDASSRRNTANFLTVS